mgnify:CR=1 FL=1
MQKKLQDMRDGLEAVSTAIDAIAANKPEISGNVEFKADGGTVSNKGIVWSGEGNTRQLTMQQDRLFSSQSFDVNKNGDYRINNRSVLNSTHLGEGVRYSNLNSNLFSYSPFTQRPEPCDHLDQISKTRNK